MKYKFKTGKIFSLLLISGMLASVPAVRTEAAVITSNATDKAAVVFHETTAYSAGDYVIYDGEMYLCTGDTQGAWSSAGVNFMQITKNHELGTSEDLSASYDASADPSEETSLMAFAANVWQKLKGFLGMEAKDEDVDVNQYKNASVSGKLNFLQKQNQQLDQNVSNLQGWITQSFQSVSNGKSILAATITDRGVKIGAQTSFQDLNQAIKDLALLQYNNGQKKGREDGLKEGYDQGRNEGHKEGYDQGRNEGHDQGYKEGYDAGSAVYHPKVWSAVIRINKEGVDKEEDCFNVTEGPGFIQYEFEKRFEGQIVAAYMNKQYLSIYGSSECNEQVGLIGTRYRHLSDSQTNDLNVWENGISCPPFSFNLSNSAGVILDLTVVYV